jgi:hypothetical protein
MEGRQASEQDKQEGIRDLGKRIVANENIGESQPLESLLACYQRDARMRFLFS